MSDRARRCTNGSIFKISSSPVFKLLAVQPSRPNALFQIPYLCRSVRLLDFKHDKDMRGSISPVLHDAYKVDRIRLIEHGERMMCHRSATHGYERYAYQDCYEMRFHFAPVD
jgi:hypothetical protein